MTERLIIRNFAGLKKVDIELGWITLFIGPQASGKSICARSLYWFKSFISELNRSLDAGEDKRVFDVSRLNSFKLYFPNLWRVEDDFILRYEIGELFVEVAQTKQKLKLLYSPSIQTASAKRRTQMRSVTSKYSMNIGTRPNFTAIQPQLTERTQAYGWWAVKIWALAGGSPERHQAFVVAGRSIFSALQRTLLTFLSTNPITDPLLQDFLREYEYAREDQPQPNNLRFKKVMPLVESILKGRVVTQKNEDVLVMADGRQVPLAYASSGQQEVFPLILFLLSYLDDYRRINAGANVLYVEEPEAHLFPESQRAVAQLMASVYHENHVSLQYVITTHSPYLLASFNNLVYAQQLAETLRDQPDKLKALYKIVPKNQQLALADMRVYGFENGTAHSLIDKESGLLSADLLDSASDVTAEQFGDLMALDPATQPE